VLIITGLGQDITPLAHKENTNGEMFLLGWQKILIAFSSLTDLASLHPCLGLRLEEMADPQRTNGSNKHQLCSVAATRNGGLSKNKRKQQTPTLYCSVVVSGNGGHSENKRKYQTPTLYCILVSKIIRNRTA
jgi:hypothetical protein